MLGAGCPFDSAGQGTAGGPGTTSADSISPDTETTASPDASTSSSTSGESITEASTDSSSDACPEDWWDQAWHGRVSVDIDHATGVEDLEGFVAPISLGGIDLRGVSLDGVDVRVVDDAGQPLPYELESWEGGPGFVWVRVPTLVAGVTHRVFVYFANPDAPAAASRAVWDGYEAVWHMAQAPDDIVPDSASASIDGQATGSSTSPGIVGFARRFDGDAVSRIDFDDRSESLFDGWEAMSLSMWIYPDYDSDSWGSGQVLDRGGSVRNGRVFSSAAPAGFGHFQIDFEFDPSGALYRRFDVPRQAWSWVVYDFDGTSLRLYLDGVLIDTVPTNGSTLISSVRALRLGADDQALTGVLDELRIARASRSESWYAAQHRAMTGAMIQVGDVERCDP
jgi:hypothetical protein